MSPQASLLLSICRDPADFEQVARGVRQLQDLDSAERFLALAGSHRLLGLSLTTCAQVVTEGPPGFDKRVNDLLRHHRRRAALFELKREIALKTLAGGGVRAVALKGGALAGTLYPDPVVRDLEDLDLLVTPHQWRQAVRALAGVGYVQPPFNELITYRRSHFHVPVDHPDCHCVELHWALTRPGSPFRLPATTVLEEARPLGGLLTPRPEAMVLHLVIQNIQEGFSRLARLVDIDAILRAEPGFDWAWLARMAQSGGLAGATALTLRLGADLLDSPVPASAERGLKPATVCATHLALLRPVDRLLDQRAGRERTLGQLLHLWLLPGAAERHTHLLKLLRADQAAAIFRGEHPGAIRRALRVARIGVRQLAAYGQGAWALTTHSGRSQMRFWSSHASSSERL